MFDRCGFFFFFEIVDVCQVWGIFFFFERCGVSR